MKIGPWRKMNPGPDVEDLCRRCRRASGRAEPNALELGADRTSPATPVLYQRLRGAGDALEEVCGHGDQPAEHARRRPRPGRRRPWPPPPAPRGGGAGALAEERAAAEGRTCRTVAGVGRRRCRRYGRRGGRGIRCGGRALGHGRRTLSSRSVSCSASWIRPVPPLGSGPTGRRELVAPGRPLAAETAWTRATSPAAGGTASRRARRSRVARRSTVGGARAVARTPVEAAARLGRLGRSHDDGEGLAHQPTERRPAHQREEDDGGREEDEHGRGPHGPTSVRPLPGPLSPGPGAVRSAGPGAYQTSRGVEPRMRSARPALLCVRHVLVDPRRAEADEQVRGSVALRGNVDEGDAAGPRARPRPRGPGAGSTASRRRRRRWGGSAARSARPRRRRGPAASRSGRSRPCHRDRTPPGRRARRAARRRARRGRAARRPPTPGSGGRSHPGRCSWGRRRGRSSTGRGPRPRGRRSSGRRRPRRPGRAAPRRGPGRPRVRCRRGRAGPSAAVPKREDRQEDDAEAHDERVGPGAPGEQPAPPAPAAGPRVVGPTLAARILERPR